MLGHTRLTHHVYAILILAALVAQPLAPAIITVEGDCTLPDAITAANTDIATGSCLAGNPGEDTIVLTENVVLTEVDNLTNGANGLPSVSSEITVEGGGFAVGRDVVAPEFRILHVSSGHLELDHVVVRNGFTRDSFNGGGGIHVDDGNLTLTNSTVSDNRAIGDGLYYYSGGGIYFRGSGDLTLTDSTVSGNTSGSYGGGVDFNGAGYLLLTESTVSDNFAKVMGGGIRTASGTATLISSTVSGNSTYLWGGGIYVGIRDNLTLINSTVSGNSAGYSGGGIYQREQAEVSLISSTISGNSAPIGGGIDVPYSFYSEERLSLYDSVLGHNLGGNCFIARLVDFHDDGSNLADDTTCNTVPDTLIGLDPVLTDNGGPTKTHALLDGSSAIDVAGDCGSSTDQRGRLRDDGSCDSGAFEFGATLPLSVSGVCPGDATLELAGAIPGGTIGLVRGTAEGATIVPGGPCPGLELGLADPTLLGTFLADGSGDGSVTPNLPGSACGLFLQALDLSTCGVSTVTQLP